MDNYFEPQKKSFKRAINIAIFLFLFALFVVCCFFGYKIISMPDSSSIENEISKHKPLSQKTSKEENSLPPIEYKLPEMEKPYNNEDSQIIQSNLNSNEDYKSNINTVNNNASPTVQTDFPDAHQDKNTKKQNTEYNKFVEKLANSVVHIKGIYLKDTEYEDRYMLLNAFGGEVFPPKKIKQQATCSGFFVSDDHCIDDAQGIDVETKNGNKYSAKIIGYYEGADLALLKVLPLNNEKFPAVKFGNSDSLAVGDNVIVIGGPLGYKWSASAGIVSGKSREVKIDSNNNGVKKHVWGTTGEYIQIDAAVNGGNSGGPAFNLKGEVVGVASNGFMFVQGMNFILASNTVKQYLPQLKDGKIISRGLWGITVKELEPYDIKAVELQKNSGMMICNVVKYSPAYEAGIRRGDIILSVDGKELKDDVALRNINNEVFAGSINEIVINRYGTIKTFRVKAENVRNIEKLEKGEIGIQEWSDGNITYRLLTSKMHKKLRFPKEVSGIIVSEIKNNDHPMLTLAVGDVIMQVNETEINSIETYQKVLKKLKEDKKTMAIFHVYKSTHDIISIKGSNIN